MVDLKTSDRFNSDVTIDGSQGAASVWGTIPKNGLSKVSLSPAKLDSIAQLYASSLTLNPKIIEFYSHGLNVFTCNAIQRMLGYESISDGFQLDINPLSARSSLIESISEIKPNTLLERFYIELISL